MSGIEAIRSLSTPARASALASFDLGQKRLDRRGYNFGLFEIGVMACTIDPDELCVREKSGGRIGGMVLIEGRLTVVAIALEQLDGKAHVGNETSRAIQPFLFE